MKDIMTNPEVNHIWTLNSELMVESRSLDPQKPMATIRSSSSRTTRLLGVSG